MGTQKVSGRVHMPSLLCRKKAGYGTESTGEASGRPVAASPAPGMTRLGALAEGVRKGVLVEVAAERVLSLLRERFEDEGDGGTARGAEAMSEPVFRRLLSLALRLRTRSVCSLKRLLSAPGKAAAEGKGGTTKLDSAGGMVTVLAPTTAAACAGLQEGTLIGCLCGLNWVTNGTTDTGIYTFVLHGLLAASGVAGGEKRRVIGD